MTTDDEEMTDAEATSPRLEWPSADGRPASRRRRGLIVAIAVVGGFMVLAVAGLGAFVFWGAIRDDDGPPKAWDPAVAKLVPEVEELRDLSFKHPVAVRYLSDKEFRDFVAVEVDELDDEQRESLRTAEASLRALGLLSGPVDLLDAVDTSQQGGVLALYDPEDEEIVVRGKPPLDVSQRATMVHELVHVLQDQHFDLEALGRRVEDSKYGSEDAFRGLIEGDASRIEFEYVAELPRSDRRRYENQAESAFERVEDELDDVPAVVATLFGAPYLYGPWVIGVLVDDGGNDAVDDALKRATFTQQIFTDALSVLDPPEVEPVPRVTRGPGERAKGEVVAFGAFDLYLVLSSRIDATDALEISLGWGGGRSRAVEADGDSCLLANIVGADPVDTAAIRRGLEAWAAAGPDGAATVTDVDGAVHLRACDPGEDEAGASPDAEIETATLVLVAYDGMVLGMFAGAADLEPAAIECVALAVLGDPMVADLVTEPTDELDDAAAGAAFFEAVPVAMEACGVEY